MIVDSSAVLAVYFLEDDAEKFGKALSEAQELYMAAPSYLETCIAAAAKRGETAIDQINDQIAALDMKILPFDHNAARMAARAYVRFGKGRGHPAQLNYGDCMSYAASKCEGMPLLFKGDDFRHTDVESAL